MHNWWWLMILSRWYWIGMRLAITSTPQVWEVWNTSIIYKVTLFYIFFNSLNSWNSGTVKNARSGLNFSYFPFLFLFYFWFIFFYSIFRTRVRETRSCCHTAGHLMWHSHKSHDTWKNIEHSERDDIIQYVIHMLTLRRIHGHLG